MNDKERSRLYYFEYEYLFRRRPSARHKSETALFIKWNKYARKAR